MVTRRVVLQLAGSLGLSLGLPPGLAMAAEAGHWMEAGARRTLMAYFDTLIPEGGVGAEMDRRLAALSGEAERSQLMEVCAWLDGRAVAVGAPSFAGLGEQARNGVLEQASRLEQGHDIRRFFESTRTLAFSTYYSRPENWTALGYDGPPQPRGFPDYAQPPKR